MTHQYLGRYFSNRGYYRLLAKPEIDNPDQRICDDISAFTSQTLSLVLVFASGVIQLVAFSGVLWVISRIRWSCSCCCTRWPLQY